MDKRDSVFVRLPLTCAMFCVVTFALSATIVWAGGAFTWVPLAKDKIHDPEGPAIKILQEPSAGLNMLPLDPSKVGNKVDWLKALAEGSINPLVSIYEDDMEMEVLDLDIMFPKTLEMPMVLFPHKKHTVWLDCENCHDSIFKMKKGGNPVDMYKILNGEFCGKCHGAVAFPLTECLRCHSVARKNASVTHKKRK